MPDEDDELVEVTFRLSQSDGVHIATVVGDFNEWSASATPMHDDGTGFVATVRLPVGRSYRYRFLVDGERWENDWHADAYVPNNFGGHDCVVRVLPPDEITPD
jgi:1,4-alpha-glucan branching enzyme